MRPGPSSEGGQCIFSQPQKEGLHSMQKYESSLISLRKTSLVTEGEIYSGREISKSQTRSVHLICPAPSSSTAARYLKKAETREGEMLSKEWMRWKGTDGLPVASCRPHSLELEHDLRHSEIRKQTNENLALHCQRISECRQNRKRTSVLLQLTNSPSFWQFPSLLFPGETQAMYV